MKNQNPKKMQKSIRIAVLLTVFALILVSIGIYLIPGRSAILDLSATKNYSLTPEIRSFLRKMEGDVTVYVLNPDGSDRKLTLFLERMSDYSNHLTLQEINTEKHPEFVEKYELSGVTVQPYSLMIVGKDRFGYLNYTDLFSFSNTTLGFSRITAYQYSYYVSLFSSNENYASYLNSLAYETEQYFEGETVITSAFEYVTREYLPTNYYLQGHGEADIADTIFAGIVEVQSSECRPLTLSEVGEVPKDAACVMILAPSADLSAEETQMLHTYLNGGGQVTFVTNEENLSMPNLCSILSAYGMTALPGGLVVMTEETPEVTDEPVEGSTEETDGTDAGQDGEVAEPGRDEDTGSSPETAGGENNSGTESDGTGAKDTGSETNDGEEKGEENTPGDSTEKKMVKSETVIAYADTDHSVTSPLTEEDNYYAVLEGANAIIMDKSLSPKADSLLLTALLNTEPECFREEAEDKKGSFAVAAAAETADGAHVVWLTGAKSYLSASGEEQQIKNAYLLYLAMQWTEKAYTASVPEAPATLYITERLNVSSSSSAIFGFLLVFVIPAAEIAIPAAVRYKRKKA